MSKEQNLNPETLLVHSGVEPRAFHGFVNPPVVHASTVLFPDAVTLEKRAQRYTYGTRGTPTTDALCEAVTALEQGEGTALVPTGLASITAALLTFLDAGDHLLIVDSVYRPSRNFSDTVLARKGIEVEYYPPSIGAGIETLVRKNTRVIFMESPGSNTFEIQDVPAIVDIARKHGIVTMIDNTWATPLLFKPLAIGVDISIQAATKYLSGHSDVLMGTISTNKECWPRMKEGVVTLGMCAAPDDTYLVLRGMRTMALRLQRHQESATRIATFLEQRSDVGKVFYPALPSHPDHALWRRDFGGAAGVFSFALPDRNRRRTHAFLNALQLFGLGFSWGGFESLAVPVDLSDRTLASTPDDAPLIRLQIGLEHAQDLLDDLRQALDVSLEA